MKLTKRDIYDIKAGTSTKFQLDDFEALKCAQSYASQLQYASDKPGNVERYKTTADRKNLTITIEAIKRK